MCGPKLPSTDRNCHSSSRNAVPMRSIWKNAAERKKATFHENGNYYCRNEVLGIYRKIMNINNEHYNEIYRITVALNVVGALGREPANSLWMLLLDFVVDL